MNIEGKLARFDSKFDSIECLSSPTKRIQINFLHRHNVSMTVTPTGIKQKTYQKHFLQLILAQCVTRDTLVRDVVVVEGQGGILP